MSDSSQKFEKFNRRNVVEVMMGVVIIIFLEIIGFFIKFRMPQAKFVGNILKIKKEKNI